MAKVWQSLFGRKPDEERLSQNEWASYFQFGGSQYPLSLSSITPYEKREQSDSSFENAVQGLYKRNGIVFACCVARSLLFSEARLQFQAIKNGRPQDLFGTTELETH